MEPIRMKMTLREHEDEYLDYSGLGDSEGGWLQLQSKKLLALDNPPTDILVTVTAVSVADGEPQKSQSLNLREESDRRDWMDDGGTAGSWGQDDESGMTFRDAAALAALPYFLEEVSIRSLRDFEADGFESTDALVAALAYDAAQAIVNRKREIDRLAFTEIQRRQDEYFSRPTGEEPPDEN